MTVRDAFFNYVYEKSKDIDLKIVTPDLGAPSLDAFRRDYSERYISVGIAEQNLISVSAGLVKSGARVIAYGLNPFPITRAYDQVRNLMSCLQYPIILTALNVGTCSAEAGYTHMPIEDYSITRCLTGITTLDISCEEMARRSLDFALDCESPIYIRFDKGIQGIVYRKDELDFKKGFVTRGNGTPTVLSYGFMARQAHRVANILEGQGLPIKVIDVFSSGFDRRLLATELEESDSILTLEDNVLPGGFGSMVLELLSDMQIRKPVVRKGIRQYDGSVLQNREMIHSLNGIDAQSIMEEIERMKTGR